MSVLLLGVNTSRRYDCQISEKRMENPKSKIICMLSLSGSATFGNLKMY
jgi:hypothetical protein